MNWAMPKVHFGPSSWCWVLLPEESTGLSKKEGKNTGPKIDQTQKAKREDKS